MERKLTKAQVEKRDWAFERLERLIADFKERIVEGPFVQHEDDGDITITANDSVPEILWQLAHILGAATQGWKW